MGGGSQEGHLGGGFPVPASRLHHIVHRPLGMLKQLFLARFERMVTRFGPWKIPKRLENGPFWEQKWVKNGYK